MESYIVTGIGTGVGKTFVSALLVAGLNASYWKPVQAGSEYPTDSQWVRDALGCDDSRILPERYRLDSPESPHSAAEKQGVYVDTDQLTLPPVEGVLIIEGAGGVMVPLNEDELYIDLLRDWGQPVVVVVDLYLGCINHTLLTLEALSHRNIPIKGLILNRLNNESASHFLTHFSGASVLGILPEGVPEGESNWKMLFDTYINW